MPRRVKFGLSKHARGKSVLFGGKGNEMVLVEHGQEGKGKKDVPVL